MSKSGYSHFLRYWLPVYLYAAVIFIFSSMSRPPLSGGVEGTDKLLHAVEYAGLGFLLARAAKESNSRELSSHFRVFAVCVAAIYGLSDEFHQSFVPERQIDFLDLLADCAGAFIGQLFIKTK